MGTDIRNHHGTLSAISFLSAATRTTERRCVRIAKSDKNFLGEIGTGIFRPAGQAATNHTYILGSPT